MRLFVAVNQRTEWGYRLKLDLNRVLDREGDAEVVTADVDLSGFRYRGVSPFTDPVVVQAAAVNRTEVVSLNCTYAYTMYLTCDRCLTPYAKPVSQKQTHTVVRALSSSEDDGYLVAPEGIVELEELTTNDIILELPGKFLCCDDCKGLCPICGCNKNSESCSCTTKQGDPRLAALDQFFEE